MIKTTSGNLYECKPKWRSEETTNVVMRYRLAALTAKTTVDAGKNTE